MPESRRIKVYKPGDVILDTYLVEEIRSGAMGNVYIADHKKWKIKLAIKAPNEKILSDKGLFNRVLKEADAWIELGLHPNIAYCYYVRQVDEVPHIFIEYVNGGNLREWIAAGKCYDLKVGLDLAIQFCHGMEQAQNHGMIHRDIKPANILMTREGTLKVTDFGLVKTSGLDTPYAGIQGGLRGDTQFASVMGTPAYMSPEQYETPLDVDRRTDIYSFGVCMYEMFCGKLPYDQATANYPASYIAKMAGKTSNDPSQIRRDMPNDLADILQKCVSLERERRYSFFDELREVLALSYRRLFDDKPPHADVETLTLKADGLNNRGVSYLDLGREDEALKCWEEALRIDPVHFESAYNHGYLKWNRVEMTQGEVLRRLEGGMDAGGDNPEHWTAFAWLYLEMGHLAKINELQNSLHRQNDDTFLAAWDKEKRRLVRTFEGHTGSISSIAILPDGLYVLSASGGMDKTLKLWEIATGKVISTFTGHTAYINQITITHDGRFALSGSQDSTLKLWEIATGKEIKTFTEHPGSIDSIAITSDNRHILSGSGVGCPTLTMKLWEIATGREISTYALNTDRTTAMVITPDGRFVLTGSMRYNTLTLWEITTGNEVRTFAGDIKISKLKTVADFTAAYEEIRASAGHTDRVKTIVVSPDGQFALSGSADNTLKLWEISTGKEVRTFKGHSLSVESAAFSPDGRFVLSGSLDKTVKLWDTNTGIEIRTFDGHTEEVNSIAITPEGRFAISGSTDNTLKLWGMQQTTNNISYPLTAAISEISTDLQQVKNAASLMEKAKTKISQGLYAAAVNYLREAQLIPGYQRDDHILDMITGCRAIDNDKELWFVDGWCKRTFTGHTHNVNSLSITPDGRFFLSGSDDKTLKLWEIATGKEIRTFTGHIHRVNSVAITPDGQFALSGSHEAMKLWKISTSQIIRSFRYHTGSIAITPNGRFALSSHSQSLILWDIATGKEVKVFTGFQGGFEAIALTRDGKFAIFEDGARNSCALLLMEIETGQVIRMFDGHTQNVTSVAITPDGLYAVSGSFDQTLRLWDLETGKEITTFKGHTEPVTSIAITPDGRFVLSGSYDNTLKLWEIDTGDEIRTFNGHTGGVLAVSIICDGRYALSGSADNTIKLWEFDWDWEFV